MKNVNFWGFSFRRNRRFRFWGVRLGMLRGLRFCRLVMGIGWRIVSMLGLLVLWRWFRRIWGLGRLNWIDLLHLRRKLLILIRKVSRSWILIGINRHLRIVENRVQLVQIGDRRDNYKTKVFPTQFVKSKECHSKKAYKNVKPLNKEV